MTVAFGLQAPPSPSPSPAIPLLQKNARKRWPPMANRNALPYKLTVISKEKLVRETTAPDPDLRRCVGHFRLHCGSILWTENDMKSRISSFEFEDDSEDENDIIIPQQRIIRQKSDLPQRDAYVVQVTEVTCDDASNQSLLDQSQQHVIEMTSKNMCCMTVPPLAG
ncbi:hypothetical protein N7495_005679 [Penicillium taxi]|uniref:uncharacterized protein n=1 Tax=Penicillium taxi TaxID=168475 RepID=UPI002544D5A7|nr:uncharacterized protein N7495_005679 [Penicillium taxi]KAJ5893988.1 hypothetical protein N7495_005679 [Penicillium taxi]